jgi:lysophospholipase L1-like esterase
VTLLPRKPALTIAALAVLIATPELVPAFYNWRVFEWASLPAVLDFRPRERPGMAQEDEGAALRPAAGPGTVRVLDPAGQMRYFYAALHRAERGAADGVVRILHYGDSPTTGDLITADARQLLQEKFGDAGHGVYLIAKPWAWYGHRGVESWSTGWKVHPATLRGAKDGNYGLAGVSFSGDARATSRFTLAAGEHDRFAISYLAQPDGGKLLVEAEGLPLGELDTAAQTTAARRQSFPLPRSARRIELRVASGNVRLFEVSFERNTPGVVYNSMGLNGAFAGVLANYMDETEWAARLKEVDPDLVIVNYGTNESVYVGYVDTSYSKDVRRILDRLKRAVPEASIMLMSPMDRGQRGAGGQIGSVPVMTRLVALQAKLAAENGVGFFNTFEAMGGPGTMGKWYMAEPRLVSADFIHPLPNGARIVAKLLFQGLMDGYYRYKLDLLRTKMAGAPAKRS